MGKTYKDQSDINGFNVIFEDDLDSDLDFDSDMEYFLNKQMTASSNRRPKSERKRRQSSPFVTPGHHRLPSDWQDFDYTSGSQQFDDWR